MARVATLRALVVCASVFVLYCLCFSADREAFVDEGLIDIVDLADNVIDRKSFAVVHRLGLRHRGVHVLIFDRIGRLLLTQRTSDAVYSPDRWTFLGEHLDAGESYHAAALRCVCEEAPFVCQRWQAAGVNMTLLTQTSELFAHVRGPVRLVRIFPHGQPDGADFMHDELLAQQFVCYFDEEGIADQVGARMQHAQTTCDRHHARGKSRCR